MTRILIDSAGAVYTATDADKPGDVIGLGWSPDEAIGNFVRKMYLACDTVTIDDISSKEEEEDDGREETPDTPATSSDETYRVQYEIDIDAASPREAAIEAYKFMREDPGPSLDVAPWDSFNNPPARRNDHVGGFIRGTSIDLSEIFNEEETEKDG